MFVSFKENIELIQSVKQIDHTFDDLIIQRIKAVLQNYENKGTLANESKLCSEAIGAIRAFICSHASKTAAPYISELAEAAVGDELGT